MLGRHGIFQSLFAQGIMRCEGGCIRCPGCVGSTPSRPFGIKVEEESERKRTADQV